jgi:hypothetical protein
VHIHQNISVSITTVQWKTSPGFDSQQGWIFLFHLSSALAGSRAYQRLERTFPEGTVYRLDDRDSNPSWCRDSLFSVLCPGSPTSNCWMPRAQFPGTKQGLEVDNTSPTAEVRNIWSHNSILPWYSASIDTGTAFPRILLHRQAEFQFANTFIAR